MTQELVQMNSFVQEVDLGDELPPLTFNSGAKDWAASFENQKRYVSLESQSCNNSLESCLPGQQNLTVIIQMGVRLC